MLNRILTLILLVSSTWVVRLGAQTYTVELQPDSRGYDAILSSANGGVNYGNNTRIRASRNTSSQYERTLMMFDLNSIPSNAVLVSANLYLYGSNHTGSGSNSSYLQIVDKPWSEGSITWNTATSMAGATNQLTLTASAGATDNYTLNVKTSLQTMVNTQARNFGYQLKLVTENNTNAQMEFYSSDETTNPTKRPKLIITYELPLDIKMNVTSTSTTSATDGAINLSVFGGTAPFTFAWSNSATTQNVSGLASGVYTVTVTDANSVQAKKIIPVGCYVGSNTFTIKSDALSFKDANLQTATLEAAIANTNYGTLINNQCLYQNIANGWNTTRAVMAFDLSSIPSNAVLQSATLKITHQANPTITSSVQIMPLKGEWNESTVTWNNQPAADAASAITFTVLSGTTAYTLNVLTHLQKMINEGTTENGWLLRQQNETDQRSGLKFYSSDHSNTAKPEITITYTLPANSNDKNLNWTKTEVFDENGNVISSEKSYADALGRNMQSLSKNAFNEVFASQVVYDQYGRPALNTLPAYVGNSLNYQDGFFKNNSGVNYSYKDFDTTTTLNNPNGLQNTVVGTLGNYYSTNNPFDKYQATATHPYNRVEYTSDPSSSVRRVAKPGNQFKMGSGRETYNFTMVSGNELNVVYSSLSFKVKHSLSAPLTNTALTVGLMAAQKSIIVTPDSKEAISFSIGNKIIATCISGLTTNNCSFAAQSNMNWYGTKSTDIHLPDVNKTSLKLPLPTYTISGVSYTVSTSDITYTITNLFNDKILVSNTDYTLNTSTRSVTFGSTFLNGYTGKSLMLRLSFDLSTSLTNTIIAQGGVISNALATYSLDYGQWSLNFYDLAGNLRVQSSPKLVGCAVSSSSLASTIYDYSHLGQVITQSHNEKGITRNVYDKEGKLRFSQNAEQQNTKRYSYINYDARGRIIETGEYNVGTLTGTTNVAFMDYYGGTYGYNSGNIFTNSIINNLDGLLNSQCENIFYTSYEAPSGGDDIPSAYTYSAQYMGKYLNGAVCRTWNSQTSTWYNYDKLGRLIATVKQIYDSEYTSYKTNIDDQIKTSETTYNNFNSLVTSSTFQKNLSTELLEVKPVYDIALRPYITYINSFAGSGIKTSEVKFDKMGRAVRNIIGNNLQGVDMVYTLDGNLKAINHPALHSSLDRGGDAGDFSGSNPFAVNSDLFGEILEYHYNDYEAANSYSVNSITSGNSIYDGLIYSQRFKVPDVVNGVNTGANYIDWAGANQTQLHSPASPETKEMIFKYTYDQYKQLATSSFGLYNNSSNVVTARNEYREGGPSSGNITYDANGNITRLVRATYSVSGSLKYYDDLTYTISTNGNQVSSILDAAVNSFGSNVNFKTATTTTPQNFTYNAIGQMTVSPAENIATITYYPNGQVKQVTFNNGSTTQYFYDDQGQKYKVKYYDNINDRNKITWYIGAAIYVFDDNIGAQINLNEMNTPSGQIRKNGSNYENIYSISDHLGNVRVTFTESGIGNGVTILSYNDYYAWGGTLPGRGYVNTAYRYGYQGQEKPEDGSLWDQFELRLFNHDLGRWFAPDPYNQYHSPYLAMGNNPINGVDPDGGYTYQMTNESARLGRNKRQMDYEKGIGAGYWSQENLTKEYRRRYKDIIDRNNLRYAGKEGVENFQAEMKLLNNEFQGLGLSGTVLETGVEIMTQSQCVLYQNGTFDLKSQMGGPLLETGWDKEGTGQIIPSPDDVIMSSANGYDLQEQEKAGILNSFGGVGLFDIINFGSATNDVISYDETGLKQYFAIVAGESGDNYLEAQAIGEVILRRLDYKGANLTKDFVKYIGGEAQFDAIGAPIYNEIMNSTFQEIFSSDNAYSTRIQGALHALINPNENVSKGAYFWNASSPESGFIWRTYNNGVFEITTSYGGTTFFQYVDPKKHWP
ncbi:MAG: DNRLRE domain-containing protein [Bacteroidia bacterium]|nr:DNRLRE domain-containing protein [Bacteroidia bacterium]